MEKTQPGARGARTPARRVETHFDAEAPARVPARQAEARATSNRGIPEHHRVLIAAAVAVACGDGARVLGIVASEPDRDTSWEWWGRTNIHGSHNLPQKDSVTRQLAKRNPGTRDQ